MLIICLFFPLLSFAQFWDSLGLGTSGHVRWFYNGTIDNELYVSGNFLRAGGDTVGCVAIWDGSAWKNLNNGTYQPQYSTSCTAVYGVTRYQGSIYASGAFFDNEVALVRWNGVSWDSITNFSSAAGNFIEYQNELYITGVFTNVDITAAWGIAKWDGQTWSAIDTTESKNKMIQIFSLLGQKIYERELNSNLEKIDMSSYPSGVYVVLIFDEKYLISRKIIKK